MNQDNPHCSSRLALYLSAVHPCAYLESLDARTLFVDPEARIDGHLYQSLIDQGFRRSGAQIYRPACRDCADCIPVRLPVRAFQPDRSQRRHWKRNISDVTCVAAPATFRLEHFALYRRYLAHRHADGRMAEDATEENYRRFLVDPWGGLTRFIELRLDGQLVGVAITDQLERGLSAVYTFFDPDLPQRGLGVFSVLSQIEIARQQGLDYLYLGYWVKASRKMAYKARFRPIEAWNGHQWKRFEHLGVL